MDLSRRFGGKKYMWDGQTYADEVQALETAQAYAADGFQVETVAEDGQHYVFTRREVKEVTAEV
ncbi:MAG: hypothetical protein M1531_11330 [Chloroflexi bacterium]|nr:hypothetical protein [Chloroflexota bacterium]